MIGIWVSWNAMDSQIELQQTSEGKKCQLVKNSWKGSTTGVHRVPGENTGHFWDW